MNKISFKRIGLSVIAGIVCISMLFGIFYSGFLFGQKSPKNILVEGITNIEASHNLPADFNIFWEAWQKLKDEHIKGGEVKNQDLLYGSIEGLTNSLQDPNTTFFRPDDSKKFEQDVVGNFGGIGAEIGIRNDTLAVLNPLPDSPAEKAGLKIGDQILEINGETTKNLAVNDAVKKIRGEIGTTVTLTILRNGNDKNQKISIVRSQIQVPTLKWTMLDNNIGHLQLFGFNENAPFLFYRTALTALLGNAQGIILDVRDNPGGFLEVAVNLAGWFLDKGTIVAKEKFRNGQETIFRSNGNAALKKIPIVILINGNSASASEILAGALRDHNHTKLIGEKSFGKGTVQELFPLKDNSKLKITIANWLLPSGTLIDHNGLTPDIEVKLTDKDAAKGQDPQLAKALEVIKEEINNKAQ